MKKGLSQIILRGSVEECLKLSKNCGYEGMELVMRDNTELNFNATSDDYTRLRQLSSQTGVELCSLCPSVGNFTDKPPEQWEDGKRRVDKALEAAAALGIDAILFIPGAVTDSIPYDLAYERSLQCLKELAPLAEKHKVAIAIENVWNKLFVSPLEARDLLNKVGSEYVGWFFDTGNVVLFGFPEQWIRILGSGIKKVHFKDFKIDHRTRTYEWTQLMDGQVNWQKVMAAFREISYDDYVISEVAGDEQTYAETCKRMDRILAL